MVTDTGSPAEPEIKRGILLPRVGAIPGVEQFSPNATAVPPPDVEPVVPEPTAAAPRHRRPGGRPRRLALVGGVCAAVLVAVVSVGAFTQLRSGPSAPDAQGPAALNQAPPVPSRATGGRPPEASANARLTPTPTPTPTRSATPHATPAARRSASSAAHHWQSLVVHATYVLNAGASVHSDRITLSLLTDGDLVLRDENGRVTWSTGTHAQGAHAVFQADGNLVVYQGDKTVWSSRTNGHNGATLVLQADGAMTILDGTTSLWSTGTG